MCDIENPPINPLNQPLCLQRKNKKTWIVARGRGTFSFRIRDPGSSEGGDNDEIFEACRQEDKVWRLTSEESVHPIISNQRHALFLHKEYRDVFVYDIGNQHRLANTHTY